MRPEHSLGPAQMGIAGDHRVRILPAQRHQGFHEGGDRRARPVALFAQPQAHIQRNLLVAAAAGMDLVGEAADPLFQLADHQRVDVFIARAGEKFLGPSFRPHRFKSLDNAPSFD